MVKCKIYTQYNKITEGGIIVPDSYVPEFDNGWIIYSGRKNYNICMPSRVLVPWINSMSEKERNSRGCYSFEVDVSNPIEELEESINGVMWHMIIDNDNEEEMQDESIKALEKEQRIGFIKYFLINNSNLHCIFDEIRDWLKNNTSHIMPDDNYYDVVFLRHMYETGQCGKEYADLYEEACMVLKISFEESEHSIFEKSLDDDHNYGKPRGLIIAHPDVVDKIKK